MIHQFNIHLGGFPGPFYSLEFKDGVFHYSALGLGEEPLLDQIRLINPSDFSHPDVVAQLDSVSGPFEIPQDRIDRFIQYAKRYCRHWKLKYETDDLICDGLSWGVEIKLTDWELVSEGHVETPGNFEEFLWRVTLMTGGKIFE